MWLKNLKKKKKTNFLYQVEVAAQSTLASNSELIFPGKTSRLPSKESTAQPKLTQVGTGHAAIGLQGHLVHVVAVEHRPVLGANAERLEVKVPQNT